MVDLLIATQNKGKLKEYRQLLAQFPFNVIGLADVGLDSLEVEETGTTFEANASLKARAYAEASGKLAIADDSGLAVDILDGRPGVYSARYGTSDLDDAGRRRYLLNEMVAIPDEQRSAHFVCVIAVYDPATKRETSVKGICYGQILHEERDGGTGFGYDPIFQPKGYTQTFAELTPEEKNRISHRGQAVALLPEALQAFLS